MDTNKSTHWLFSNIVILSMREIKSSIYLNIHTCEFNQKNFWFIFYTSHNDKYKNGSDLLDMRQRVIHVLHVNLDIIYFVFFFVMMGSKRNDSLHKPPISNNTVYHEIAFCMFFNGRIIESTKKHYNWQTYHTSCREATR